MYKTASFVIANNGRTAYWSRSSDSHEVIINEHRLVDCVRVVFTPPGNNFSAPMDKWTLGLEQNNVPSWYDPKQARKAVMAAWDEYRAARFVCDGERTVTNNDFVIAYGFATVEAHDYATIRAYGYATVRAYDSATVKAYGYATIRAYGYATIRAYCSATVRASDSATAIRLSENSIVGLHNAAVLIDRTGYKPICVTAEGTKA